ncbi:MAG: S-methyl-5-thioribose-1-phosphate isomerase, partial [Spongiibacteraceae bacterium]|nr:S-methyl-5-thioribose-1-phosphate isomerase [Spongiibacteraceae bacterium]
AGSDQLPQRLEQLAQQIHADDVAAKRRLGDFGAALIEPGSVVYTHCNTGALATGGYGTALGVIRSTWQQQRLAHVLAGETRPWWQGARLTAWELMREGIPFSLNVDAAAAHLMRERKVAWVIVGADRIAANGDTANKIGTYSLAVLARHHGARFMVAAPCSTFDLAVASGTEIPIEERPCDEVTAVRGIAMAPRDCGAVNPAFDVTPAGLIDAIVTERGVIMNPTEAAIAAHFAGEAVVPKETAI